MNTIYRKNEDFNTAESGLSFTLTIVCPYALMLIVTAVFQFGLNDTSSALFRYISYFATQISYLAVAAFIAKQKGGLRVFRAEKFHWKYVFLGLALSYGMLFGLGYLNELFVGALENAGLHVNGVAPPLDGAGQFALSLVLIGLMPAICEETLFRGAVLRGTAYMNVWAAMALNGLMFSLFHQNPAQTVYPFLTGCVFALVALRSGSVFPSVIMHAVNNVAILCISYFAPQAQVYNAATLTTGLVLFAAAFAYLAFFDKSKDPAAVRFAPAQPLHGKYFFYFAAVGLVLCVVSWIVALAG